MDDVLLPERFPPSHLCRVLPAGRGFLQLIGDSEGNAFTLVYDLIANDNLCYTNC